jgi:hypothetical protein
MVNVDTSLKSSMDSVLTPRIVAKTTASTPEAATSDAAADFRALFTSRSNPPVPVLPAAPKVVNPTAQSVFGENAWIANPGGVAPNGVAYGYNPEYFATRATADKLAQMYGGKVEEANAITPYGPFRQNQMNEMIRFSNGNVVNAGILASYFNRGLTQEQIDTAIAGEIRQFPG